MAITGTVAMTETVRTAFDTAAYFGFRPMNLFRQAGVDVKWDLSSEPKKGNAVTFTKINKMASNITPIPETTDITPTALGVAQVTVTLDEYGDAVQTTERLRAQSFLDVQNLVTMKEVGEAMGESIDLLARAALDAGTNIIRPAGIANDAATLATSIIQAKLVAQARAKLSGDSVPRTDGLFYLGQIHPDVAFDLTGETGGRGWRDPHVYSDPANIYTAELGAFEGVRFVENPRARLQANAGSGSTVDVYTTYIYGWQAIAEARGIEPEIRLTGPFDILGRFLNTAWYAMIAWGVFRQESIRLIKTASSIGTN